MWKNSLNGKPRRIKKVYNLKNPVHARDWLNTIRLHGKPITTLETQDGNVIDVRNCPDEQIVEVAKQVQAHIKKSNAN